MPQLSATNLTDAIVRNSKPRDKRYDVFDAKLRGFGLRVQTSGTKSWFVMRRVNGKMTRKTIGRYPEITLANARIGASGILSRMARGEVTVKPSPLLFDEAIDDWISRDQGQNKTVQQVRNAIDLYVRTALKGRKLNAITKNDINKIVDGIMDSGTGVQANRLLAYLRRFFNWCVERDYLKSNPTTGIPKPFKERSRDRVLSAEEIQAVYDASSQLGYPFGPLFQLLTLTGQRRDEVGEATWDEIDIESATWTIGSGRAKNGLGHVVHLSNQALELLSTLPRFDGQNFLFSTNQVRPVSGFSKAKKRLDRLSNVDGWTLHDLRRSFATHATERLGFSPVVIDKVLNHQSGAVRGVAAVYQRGAHLKERKDVLTQWGEFVSGLQNGPPPPASIGVKQLPMK